MSQLFGSSWLCHHWQKPMTSWFRDTARLGIVSLSLDAYYTVGVCHAGLNIFKRRSDPRAVDLSVSSCIGYSFDGLAAPPDFGKLSFELLIVCFF